MELKIDLRMPLAVLKRMPFIYTGQDFKSLPCGKISSILSYSRREFERVYPITVSKLVRNEKIVDLLFCFSFLYVDDEEDLALFLTQPCWLNEFEDHAALRFLIRNVEELAKLMNSSFIKVELQEEPTSFIAFPTSLSHHFSYDISKSRFQRDYLSTIKRCGFSEEDIILCYEINVQDIKKGTEKKRSFEDDYTTRRLDLNELETLSEDINNFPIRAYSLSTKDLFLKFENLPPLQDTLFAAYSKNEFVGFIRWYPDLIGFSEEYHLPDPLLFHHHFKEYSFKYGKILDWAFKIDDSILFCSLLNRVLSSMKQKGLEKCQIAYISNKQSSFKNFLKRRAFRRVHGTRLLTKGIR